jgi:hypothetical protein
MSGTRCPGCRAATTVAPGTGLSDGVGPNRQLAHAYPRILKDDDGAGRDRLFDRRHVRKQQSDLFRWFAIRAAPKDDQRRRRLVREREKRAEIGISRHDDAVFDRSMLEDDPVVRALQPTVAHMNRVVTTAAQPLRHQRRKGTVHQESHGFVSGSARSRTASAANRSAS